MTDIDGARALEGGDLQPHLNLMATPHGHYMHGTLFNFHAPFPPPSLSRSKAPRSEEEADSISESDNCPTCMVNQRRVRR